MNFRLSFWIGFGLEVGKREIIFNIFPNWTNVYGFWGDQRKYEDEIENNSKFIFDYIMIKKSKYRLFYIRYFQLWGISVATYTSGIVSKNLEAGVILFDE